MSDAPPLPTDAELEILAVLWDDGWSTVRNVWTRLSTHRAMVYTTVLKFMQIMHAKGLVQRDESRRTHLYNAVDPKDLTQRKLITDLVARAFNNSPIDLVRQTLAIAELSAADRQTLRALIEQLANPPPPSPAAPAR